MSLDLLYITNNKKDAKKAEDSGVEIIFIDLERKGKIERQGHLDTVISNHCFEDIKRIKNVLQKSKVLVRVNPLDDDSENEISEVIKLGADIVMLPMFKTAEEVRKFIKIVDKKAEVCLLLETSQAFCRIDDILKIDGIDRIHIGLNDLHLSLGLDFMFECLADGIVEYLAEKIRNKNIKLGIGGIARINEGELPAEKILKEHIRLGSEMVILSRSFKKADGDIKIEIEKLKKEYEKNLKLTKEELLKNKEKINDIVNLISYKRREHVL